ncbi:unnamed protein product [Sphenostylis stenocarpa]|uniref:Uncharacterized protein n=1 Tax=Sphenostylis stenocarpa TaxID=92480 RepID=A0AA86VFE6_9FABA|nr:unnamed protein product [Sphenostylis stenocarpa]
MSIEMNISYDVPFGWSPGGEIHHIISCYIYEGTERDDNAIQILQRFYDHDVLGRPTRYTLERITCREVELDSGDFSMEDLSPEELAEYASLFDDYD